MDESNKQQHGSALPAPQTGSENSENDGKTPLMWVLRHLQLIDNGRIVWVDNEASVQTVRTIRQDKIKEDL